MVDQTQEINRKENWGKDLPLDMKFNEGHIVSIVTYSVLMVLSGVANITVLILILKRRRHSRNSSMINTMLMNLAIADLIVTFLMMPLEIGWNATVSWEAGDFMCRIMAFFRIFGLYLSGFVHMCISMDRYYAVLKPLSMGQIKRRGRIMLVAAWAASLVFSVPQIAIFHVESHPNFTEYTQCVTYNFFTSDLHDLLYKYFGLVMMYGLPLCVIIFCYSSILCEIYRKYRDCYYGKDIFRRPSAGFLGRARIRTLKMTISIVLGFIVCWTPYYVMCLWYWMDKESAAKVDQKVQKGLFIFASANSIMNPVVYGFFNVRTAPQQPRSTAVTRTPPLSVIPDVINSDRNVKAELPRSKTLWKLQWQRSFSSDKNDAEDVNKEVVKDTEQKLKKNRLRRMRWQLRTQRSFSSEGTDIADIRTLEDPVEVFERDDDMLREESDAEARRRWWRQRAQRSNLSSDGEQQDRMGKCNAVGWKSWLSHQGREEQVENLQEDVQPEKPSKASQWSKWLSTRQPSDTKNTSILGTVAGERGASPPEDT